jgi:formylglycine-generating enzyme required for sulfatase activity
LSVLRWLSAFAALALLGCQSDPEIRPQWRVTLTTDAPLPTLADRLLVEVVDAGGAPACTACRRTFDVRAESFPLSFGVVPERSGTWLVRARLYRARDSSAGGEPSVVTTLDARMRLPSEPSDVFVEIGAACFGVPSAADVSCDARTGSLEALKVAPSGRGDPAFFPGSFEGARVAPCTDRASGPVGADEVCVDGGLFVMRASPTAIGPGERDRAQLVRVPSFVLDRDEVSVGRFRELARRGLVSREPRRGSSARNAASLCTFRGPDDPSADDMPLSCVDRELAREVCRARGMRLPTEAEFAYVAGNGPQSTDYPWGDEPTICEKAVIGREALGTELEGGGVGSPDCRLLDPTRPYGPASLSSPDAARDVTLAGVRGLAGNLEEWVEDDFVPLTDACWRGVPFVQAPVCRSASRGPALRGGAWIFPAFSARATFRAEALDPKPSTFVGFRCARDL